MSNYTIRSSKPSHWVRPRPHTDAGLRQHHYGRIEPMGGEPDPRRGTLRLVLLIAALFVLLVTVGSETGRAILLGLPV